jgi:non-heme chloroperoxidase
MRTARLVKNATLKIYSGGSHGFAQTHAAQFNQDLLSFIKTGKVD